jgi:hypothetical protein
MPLSNKKIKKKNYLPLIQRVKNKLSGWKTPLLSSGGRATLMNSTLSAIPILFMFTFILPTWVIKEIDKIRRKFLWHGHKESTTERYISPIAWKMVMRPKHMEGIEVKDLKYMNQAMMAKHIWNKNTKQTTLHILYDLLPHKRPWMQHNPTHFWKGI